MGREDNSAAANPPAHLPVCWSALGPSLPPHSWNVPPLQFFNFQGPVARTLTTLLPELIVQAYGNMGSLDQAYTAQGYISPGRKALEPYGVGKHSVGRVSEARASMHSHCALPAVGEWGVGGRVASALKSHSQPLSVHCSWGVGSLCAQTTPPAASLRTAGVLNL